MPYALFWCTNASELCTHSRPLHVLVAVVVIIGLLDGIHSQHHHQRENCCEPGGGGQAWNELQNLHGTWSDSHVSDRASAGVRGAQYNGRTAE